jgi:hypothetical protein
MLKYRLISIGSSSDVVRNFRVILKQFSFTVILFASIVSPKRMNENCLLCISLSYWFARCCPDAMLVLDFKKQPNQNPGRPHDWQ